MYDHSQSSKPLKRLLRGYAFDPSLSLSNATVGFNEIIFSIPWEDLDAGPVGEYVEVIDFDPTIPVDKDVDQYGRFFKPVDLNDPNILAKNGLAPSDSNPMFHQQMVYAIAMITIKNFEHALGRKVIWRELAFQGQNFAEYFVEKLRIYPHALREPNAYYSPSKKALLFGYFRSTPAHKSLHMPNSWVFTCLSHDIIAHETSHAILDGVNQYYNEPTNPDVLAFHEAFADIIALFQHFTFPEVLKSQIAKTQGNLDNQNLLGQLAQEFGSAIGGYGSLRDAIGEYDKNNQWQRKVPDPAEYDHTLQPHKRGSILVATIFDVFLNIYKSRVSDLLRIASGGTGILPEGELHPDLVNRLAKEASKSAKHILSICIRALDYCPPVDVTFGEYLRAIITADCDLLDEDDKNYRLAFIEAFKKRGIYPEGISTLSIDSLRYDEVNLKGDGLVGEIINILEDYSENILFKNSREQIFVKTKEFIAGTGTHNLGLHHRIHKSLKKNVDLEKLFGIIFHDGYKKYGINDKGQYSGQKENFPSFWITNLREIRRVGPDGKKVNHVLFSIVQTARLKQSKRSENGFRPVRGSEVPRHKIQRWSHSDL